MPVRKRSGLAACHQASIHDLPAPLLAHIFSFIERRDVLSVLLVSNTWLAAAEEHCAALWDELWLHSDRVCLEGALAKKEFQAVFKKRAASMSTTLHVRGRTEAFTGLLSSLLRAFKCSGSRLRVLDLDVAFMKRRHYTACCKAVGQLTALRRLRLVVTEDQDEDDSDREAESLPLTPLLQLSSLSCLEALEVGPPTVMAHEAQALNALLPSLASLTQLGWANENHYSRGYRVTWLRPDGSGPSLRHLRLHNCYLGTPGSGSEATNPLLRSLQHLERLELKCAAAESLGAFVDVLPQLPALTSLTLEDVLLGPEAEQRVLLAVLLCPHLQDLSLLLQQRAPGGGLPRVASPGSLQQLTRLVVRGCDGDPLPAWSLPRLKYLQARMYGATDVQSLALHQSLEELVLHGDEVTISQVTQAISQLTRLTRLSISIYNALGADLHDAPYLAGLKELVLRQYPATSDYTLHSLPPALVRASALEGLNLSNDMMLALRREDLLLLAELPSLKSLYLPLAAPITEAHMRQNAVLVAHMRDELSQAGITVSGDFRGDSFS